MRLVCENKLQAKSLLFAKKRGKNGNSRNSINSNRISDGCFCSINMQRAINEKGVNILSSAIIIGIITFLVCIIGVKIGNKFGDKYERKAEIVGGLILILMGIKILLEHLGVL